MAANPKPNLVPDGTKSALGDEMAAKLEAKYARASFGELTDALFAITEHDLPSERQEAKDALKEVKRTREEIRIILLEVHGALSGQGTRNDRKDVPDIKFQAWVKQNQKRLGFSLRTAERIIHGSSKPEPPLPPKVLIQGWMNIYDYDDWCVAIEADVEIREPNPDYTGDGERTDDHARTPNRIVTVISVEARVYTKNGKKVTPEEKAEVEKRFIAQMRALRFWSPAVKEHMDKVRQEHEELEEKLAAKKAAKKIKPAANPLSHKTCKWEYIHDGEDQVRPCGLPATGTVTVTDGEGDETFPACARHCALPAGSDYNFGFKKSEETTNA